MKKVLFAAIAALAITSCSQNEELNGPDNKSEIKVGTTAITRASVLVTSSFRTFKAYAYSHDESYVDNVSGVKIMDATFTSTDGTTWVVQDDQKFYWPASGSVNFFAYSPEVGADGYSYTTGKPTVKYVVKDAIVNQEDFVVSQKVVESKPADGSVSLNFKHALTQVVFKLQGDNAINYTVTGLKVKGIKNSGTYGYEDVKGSWTTDDTTKDYSMVFENLTFIGGTSKELTAKDQLLILMPQTLNNASVEVTYSAKMVVDGVDVTLCANETKTAKLTGTWSIGDKFTYTLVLKAGDEMKVTGDVEENWTPKDPAPDDIPVNTPV